MRQLTEAELAELKSPDGRLTPYFRRGRGDAESNYPAIEFGYCLTGGDFRVVAKRVIGREPDIIWAIDSRALLDDPNYSTWHSMSIDVTRDGYWCIIGNWRWDEEWKYSTAKLQHGPKEKT